MAEAAIRTGALPLQSRPSHWVARKVLAGLTMLVALPLPALSAGQSAAATAYPLACAYFHRDLDQYAHCARREGGMVRVAPAHAARMHFERGLAELRVPGIGCLWVRRDGLALPVFMLDNGPDPFAQGLVRHWRDGKVAFSDRRLRLVLATPYDWAFPFNARGEALVCEGCRSDGREPASMVGGRWGLIDRTGRLTMPLRDGEAAHRQFFGWR
ncbi:MAG TPA: hypothetical protein VGU70_12070 [Methylobacterium sp.]|jgi:hypothetical protein|uniref:hypothetical protein n=1 Tax=Methylorubrum sp. B1-46 TaxID=2897334 RepID=UPI001E34A177|nr:hypothetical protein [Methylorubrum sp. B1-46]UGB27614.1 hypothetical protein LPC10_08635 [Methylorubrum sp. B1-46]HEV2543482.1 hypothetical protein [Methylobacterium sp.]